MRILRGILEFLSEMFGEPEPQISTERCIKDPSKECGSHIEITCNGTIHRRNVSKCCKVFDTTKHTTKVIASCEPNTDYNGVIFSKSVVETAKQTYEKIKHVSYVGPVCEENKIDVDE